MQGKQGLKFQATTGSFSDAQYSIILLVEKWYTERNCISSALYMHYQGSTMHSEVTNIMMEDLQNLGNDERLLKFIWQFKHQTTREFGQNETFNISVLILLSGDEQTNVPLN